MGNRLLLLGAAAILAIGAGSVTAQAASEGEIGVMHSACKAGDREACVRFGAALKEHHDHEAEWRRSHEEWYR
jgi:hypothetical protein